MLQPNFGGLSSFIHYEATTEVLAIILQDSKKEKVQYKRRENPPIKQQQ
jgi:hypothetical protein